MLDARPKHRKPASNGPGAAESVAAAEVRLLSIASIRTDGGTQHRFAPNPNIIKEYAELMLAGVEFPPVDVRCDGENYWLSDGFQRLDAAKLAHLSTLRAAVRAGTREDAQWDSYAANASHGLRRTAAETEKVIERALQHPNAKKLTDVCLSKHLHVPRTTVRYWRNKLSCQSCQDASVRTVTRGNTAYDLHVTNLGKKSGERRTSPRRNPEAEIADMREKASELAKDILNVIEKWVRRQLPSARFLELIENILERNGDHVKKDGTQRVEGPGVAVMQ